MVGPPSPRRQDVPPAAAPLLPPSAPPSTDGRASAEHAVGPLDLREKLTHYLSTFSWNGSENANLLFYSNLCYLREHDCAQNYFEVIIPTV